MPQHSSADCVHVVAVISPAPGKFDRVKELLLQLTKKVEASEPGAIKYEAFEQVGATGDPVLVVEETYKDQASLDKHGATDYFAEVGKTIAAEGLLAGPLDIKVIKPIGGFLSR